LIPSKENIDNLKIDDLIKLVLVMYNKQRNGCRAERMWIELTDKKDGIFYGKLTNQPFYLKSLNVDDVISFKEENIAEIYIGESSLNEKILAIITKRAFENKQINWIIRTDEINNEQDSGWQLYYGNEDEQYLSDSSKALIISIEQVLSFEPLLEPVFKSTGYAYEYSKSDNKFIEVEE